MHYVKSVAERVGPPPAPRGFTLVELMVTVVVLAVVVGLAVPSFTNMIHSNRLTAASNEFVGALQTARLEAVRRNARAVLCPSTDGTSCAGTSWARLIVFVDANSNGAKDAAEIVIRDVEVVRTDGGISITPSSTVSSNNRIWFASDGRIRVGSTPANQGAMAMTSTRLEASGNTRRVEFAISRINTCKTSGATASCT